MIYKINKSTDTMHIYLDHAATTPLSDSMKKYLILLLDLYGNPSSIHSVGEPVKQILLSARQSVAEFINADSCDIYFTPSGSASNTLAVRGYYSKHDCHLLYSPIAHKSILTCAEHYPYADPLKVDRNGFIDIEDLKNRLKSCNTTPLVVIDYANSEIGTIQNVKEIINLVHRYHGIIYLDCTGSIPTIPVDIKKLDADMLGFSSHKLGGLKGCGILYKKSSVNLEPLIYGSQENGLSGGTEHVLGIASLGKAVKDHDYASITTDNRDYLYHHIIGCIPDCYLIGPAPETQKRLPHNLYLCFKGVEGESLMFLLDRNGIQVSTGSACNSSNLLPSPALSAIQIEQKDMQSCIRLSLCGRENKKELDYICDKLKDCVDTLRKLNHFA